MSREERDNKNKQMGMMISAAFHVAVILLFIFLVAWRAPNPPHPEIGVELNFGTSDAGTGDIQPETPPEATETEEQTDPAEEEAEEVTEPMEEFVENAIEEAETDPVQETQAVSNEPTPDPIEEPKEKVEKKVEEVTPKVEEKKEEPKTEPKLLYPGTKTDENTGDTSHGDKTDATGDQGDEEGDVDARSLYGKAGGGGGGPALSISGWNWDYVPRPEHDDVEFGGKITFEFQVDDKGQVISVKTIPPSTVSSSLIRLYKDELEKVTFSPTSSATPQPFTKGKVTFIIKAK
ncbi:MAG: hypothetical protein ABFS32_03200 [Bacteroidota bacterium]